MHPSNMMTEQEMPGWQKQKNQEEERQAQSAVMPTEPENEELEAEMIRMEEGASAQSSPPPPNLQANMSNREEGGEGREMDDDSSVVLDPQDDAGAKTIPAGAKSSSEPSILTPKLPETQEGAKPLYVPGHQPSKMEEQPTYIINTETKLGTIQDHPETMLRRSR